LGDRSSSGIGVELGGRISASSGEKAPMIMQAQPLLRIKSVEPKPGYRLSVYLDQGPPMTIDLTQMIERGGVFASLRENDNFSKVRIGKHNRILEWPLPKDDDGYPIIEIDAESLFYMASQQGLRQRIA
jgi:hypothetical protein